MLCCLRAAASRAAPPRAKSDKPSAISGRRYSFYLLYWYKSTNTDAACRRAELPPPQAVADKLLADGKVPALKASLEDDDDEEERALDLFSAWKGKKAGTLRETVDTEADAEAAAEDGASGNAVTGNTVSGNTVAEGRIRQGADTRVEGGVEVDGGGGGRERASLSLEVGSEVGSEIDDGILVIGKGRKGSSRPENVNPGASISKLYLIYLSMYLYMYMYM
jgi:hypothetical protein